MGKVIGYIPEPAKKSQKSKDAKAEKSTEQLAEQEKEDTGDKQ